MTDSFPYYHTYVENPFACENTFGARLHQPNPWAYYNFRNPLSNIEARLDVLPKAFPSFEASKSLLPQPFWDGHESTLACYWKVWELAFKNFRHATLQNRFYSDFSATAFNNATFLWDSAFITLFGRYGRRAWPFQNTLNNFYAKQHPDGFICREIRESDGEDRFQRFDPAGTGPNVLAWSEWEYYQHTGDLERLKRVFPPLVAYSQWMRRYRTWPNGSYWATGWSSGMDNQPRFPGMFRNDEPHRVTGSHEWLDHASGTWMDSNFQALLAAKTLVRMAEQIGRKAEVVDFQQEARFLQRWVNRHLWDSSSGFYHDLDRRGSRQTNIKSIGAYWALLAGAVPKAHLTQFISHLQNTNAFKRAHHCPSISADTPGFDPDGGYWRGGVWPPTNYMLLCGLRNTRWQELAFEIACNHLYNVVDAFQKTGTLWENYAPDEIGKGNSTTDFVGWSGLPPTSVLFEYVFGIQPDVPHNQLTWDIRLLDAHGVENYPFGLDGTIHLRCDSRKNYVEEPHIEVSGNITANVLIRWAGGKKVMVALAKE